MDSCTSSIEPTKNVKAKSLKKTNTPIKHILDEISKEYCLKRNNCNPHGPSPNMFVTKLQWRMNAYYKDLYNSCNFDVK